MAKNEITFGDVEVSDEDFEPHNVRRRISIMIPEGVLAKLRQIAAAEGKGYQTIANEILREAVSLDGKEYGERWVRIKQFRVVERQVAQLTEQLASLVEKKAQPPKKRAKRG